ncbi:MAG: FHA domain-containing protein [Telluria sp.]
MPLSLRLFLHHCADMHRCRDPEHPHCTVWVIPGADACAHGHPQPAAAASASAPPPAPRQAARATDANRPHLHISGFDPRAAGGRHAIKLELRDLPADCPQQLTMQLKSALQLQGPARHAVTRGANGLWCPAFVEFSSRGLEHGQHRIEVELHGRSGDASRAWICSMVVLVPRADASLAEIHHAFLANHKNVRVFADDGSIARVNAQAASGSVDIDVTARNAGIARLELDASRPGRIDVGLPTIAWDEELVEVDPAKLQPSHPYPARAACLDRGTSRARLFAGDEFVIGRFDPVEPEAQVLLAHPGSEQLSRRISARHAVVRRTQTGYTIEDVSRYGILVDGQWPGKTRPLPLREGMRIEFTASFPGIATLEVSVVRTNAVALTRVDRGGDADTFWLVASDAEPDDAARPGQPLLFHRGGGFWMRDPVTQQDEALAPASTPALPSGMRFIGGPYPETWNVRARTGDRRRSRTGAFLSAG